MDTTIKARCSICAEAITEADKHYYICTADPYNKNVLYFCPRCSKQLGFNLIDLELEKVSIVNGTYSCKHVKNISRIKPKEISYCIGLVGEHEPSFTTETFYCKECFLNIIGKNYINKLIQLLIDEYETIYINEGVVSDYFITKDAFYDFLVQYKLIINKYG